MRWLVHLLAVALVLSGFQPAQASAMAAMTQQGAAMAMSAGDHAAMMDHGAMGHDMAAMTDMANMAPSATEPNKSGNNLPCSAKMLPCCISLPASLNDPDGPGLPPVMTGLRLMPSLNMALVGLTVAPLPDPPRALSA